MSLRSEAVKRWRKKCKERIILAMGGACCICGYNKCTSALVLHHLDPAKKEFSLGAIRANPKNWDLIVKELKKCILLCHNCHSEIHEKLISIPINIASFNDLYLNFKKDSDKCSKKSTTKSPVKINWDSVDLKQEIKTKSIVKIAEELGCSDAAVHKRLRKLGLK